MESPAVHPADLGTGQSSSSLSAVQEVVQQYALLGDIMMGAGVDGVDMETEGQLVAHPEFQNILGLMFACRKVGEEPTRMQELDQAQQKAQDSANAWRAHQLTVDGGVVAINQDLNDFMERLSRLLQSYMYELEAVHQDAAAMCEDFESCLLRVLQDSEPRAPTHDIQCDLQPRCAEEPIGLGLEEDKQVITAALKKRYEQQISDLCHGFVERKTNGKLPQDATQHLHRWWQDHFTWPYLSYYGAESVHKGLGGVQDSDKKAMEEETGLSTTQINNWFINQRKRHWHKYFMPEGLPQTATEAASRLAALGVLQQPPPIPDDQMEPILPL